MGDQSKTLIGGNVVVASGTVVIPDGATAQIIPVNVGLNPLTFQFAFETNGLLPTQVVLTVLVGNLYQVTVRNFDSQIGNALIEPMQAGAIGGRRLFLNLAVHPIGQQKTIRLLTYTFTLEGAGNVG
jgi:hypothetical protein